MSRSQRPRRAYRPRPIAMDNFGLALHHAAKPPAADRDEILQMLSRAIKALREGVATEGEWSIAAGAVTVALAIERQGIVRGLHGHIKLAEDALQAIYDRAISTGGGRWIRVTLYFNEIEALNDLEWLQTYQLNQLGRAEFLAAIDAAKKDTIAQGCTATVVRDIERLAA